MKVFLPLIALISATVFSCKDQPAVPKLVKYYVVIDGVQKTEAGLTEVNSIDTLYCKDDKAAIVLGLDKYYDAVVATQTRDNGTETPLPYLVVAKGWAVLDAQGENVKTRVTDMFVDSCTQEALEKAQYKIENMQVQ